MANKTSWGFHMQLSVPGGNKRLGHHRSALQLANAAPWGFESRLFLDLHSLGIVSAKSALTVKATVMLNAALSAFWSLSLATATRKQICGSCNIISLPSHDGLRKPSCESRELLQIELFKRCAGIPQSLLFISAAHKPQEVRKQSPRRNAPIWTENSLLCFACFAAIKRSSYLLTTPHWNLHILIAQPSLPRFFPPPWHVFFCLQYITDFGRVL